MTQLIIGIGNSFRRDDGVGLAVADEISRLELPGLEVLTATGESGTILDAWTGVSTAVVVDAALVVDADPTPGRIRRWTPGDQHTAAVSSHALGLPATYALGQALGRLPGRLAVLTVDVTEVGYGEGLTPEVAAAVPRVVATALSEFGR